MPAPSFIAKTPDTQAMSTLLANFERRITELERRTVQIGQRVTVGGYAISVAGTQLVATRLTDGKTVVLADFGA